MEIYLIRHAIAAERNPILHPSDGERPLTAEGKRRMELAARGMRALGLPIDVILTSPLTRARQTARIVAAAYRPRPPVRVLRPLAAGGGIGGVLAGLASFPESSTLALVGHEPDLSMLAGAFLLSPRGELSIDFKKGALCRIAFAGTARPGAGRLVMHLTPRVLRRLGAGES